MRPETPALLWDAGTAAHLIATFISRRSFSDYTADPMLRSAVERQFEIVGEALNRLRKVDPQTAARIPDLARVVAFRNILAHGYAVVDHAIVWQLATQRLPELAEVVRNLSAEVNGSAET